MAYILPFLVAQGIYTGIITTISGVVIGTVKTVKAIYTHRNPNVDKIVNKLDLERKLILIQSVLRVINDDTTKKNIHKLNNLEKTQIFESIDMEIDINKDPVELCLIFLQQIIQKINNDLDLINKRVANHNMKWFKSWRKLNIKDLLDNLEQHSFQLDSRFDDLTKISVFLKDK